MAGVKVNFYKDSSKRDNCVDGYLNESTRDKFGRVWTLFVKCKLFIKRFEPYFLFLNKICSAWFYTWQGIVGLHTWQGADNVATEIMNDVSLRFLKDKPHFIPIWKIVSFALKLCMIHYKKDS